ncbi:MAG: tyrosine-type recombinase/integrase [Methylocella sp.]
MPRARISKRSVDALACPPGKDRDFLWDDALAGFGVAAFPSGKKVYVTQYRQNGRSRRATIGEHGRLTPDEARSEAKKLLGAIESGADPIAQRRATRTIPLFREVADQFMRTHVGAKRKARTLDSYETLLRLHILPSIGSLRVTDVRRSNVSKIHADLADHPGAANRSLSVISAIWNWAAIQHEDLALPANPAKGIKRNPEEGRERYLTTDELARLGDVLAEAETSGLAYRVDESRPAAKHAPKPENRRRRIDPFAIGAIRLLILTGARLREILTAKWDYIDFERGLLNLPTSKTGKKSLFLSAAALEVLAALPRMAGNPYVVPGEKSGAPRVDLKNPWAAVTQAAGLEGLRLHDLRHSFASVGAGGGLGLQIIGKLLGHSQPATTARYSHLDNDPMQRAVNQIGNTISAAMNRKPGAEVVPLARAK